AEAKIAYETGDLRDRLARYHADTDNAFRGWNDAWLDPGFKSWNIEAFVGRIRVPILAIQGRDDQYGTLPQMDALAKGARAPLRMEVVENCRHSPHIEQPDCTLAIVSDFLAPLMAGEMGGGARRGA